MKKEILIDTSYLLALFGIEVDLKNISNEEITEFWIDGMPKYNINISDISLLETLFKLNSDYRKLENSEILHRYEKILPTVLNIPFLNIIQSKLDPMIINFANIVRTNNHTDYLDCLISGTALRIDAYFITEDKALRSLLSGIDEFKRLKIMTLHDLLNY